MNTNRWRLVSILMIALLAGACASQPTADAPRKTVRPTVTVPPSPAKEEGREDIPAKTVAGEIVGRPAQGSKFARLKLGMTLKQVEQLIGPPTWRYPSDRHATAARKAVRYSYKREGVLTFNDADEPLLIRILVNRIE